VKPAQFFLRAEVAQCLQGRGRVWHRGVAAHAGHYNLFGPIAMDKLWRQQSLNGSRHFMVTDEITVTGKDRRSHENLVNIIEVL